MNSERLILRAVTLKATCRAKTKQQIWKTSWKCVTLVVVNVTSSCSIHFKKSIFYSSGLKNWKCAEVHLLGTELFSVFKYKILTAT